MGGHTRLGYAYYRQARYDDAIREYRRELEMLSVGDHVLRERTSIELQQKLGAAYRRQNDLDGAERHETQAIRSFEARLARGADDAATRYYMAVLYGLRGEAEAAQRHLEPVLKELPAFTKWRVPRDPDFDPVRAQLRLG